jgi:hypothetical protein
MPPFLIVLKAQIPPIDRWPHNPYRMAKGGEYRGFSTQQFDRGMYLHGVVVECVTEERTVLEVVLVNGIDTIELSL